MDQTKYQEAQQAYDGGDFRTAAKLFLAAAGKGAAGNGAAYHMAGNALMRLRRHHDAVTVYGHALRDETYDKRGAVFANLGQAYCSAGDYAAAVKAFEDAIAEPGYLTQYKAYQGMASALMERHRVEEAAVAYRKAALDGGNPDPGKALVNLGLCFMAMGRPSDAVEAYKAALGFDGYQGRGKALSNLGQAYVASGDFDEAVKAFEKATQLHGHRLSEAAQQAYDLAVEQARPKNETVEGWETGEMPVVELAELQPGGWDTDELAALTGATPASAMPAAEPQPYAPMPQPYATEAPTYAPAYDAPDYDAPDYDTAQPNAFAAHGATAAAELGFGDESAVSDFFALTEDEMRARDREARRAARAEDRANGGLVRSLVTGLVVLVVLAGALGAAYWFGLGWPTQGTTVKGLMVAYQKGEEVEKYWVAVPDKDVAKEMAKIPPVKSFTVDEVDPSAQKSVVAVTVTPKKGAPLRYAITLTREGVGWKVTGVDNNWRSTGG